MKKTVLLKTCDGGKISDKTVIQLNDKIADSENLPPIEMKSYAFSPNQLYKKKKSVQNAIQEAESQIAVELGRTVGKKKTSFNRQAIRWFR